MDSLYSQWYTSTFLQQHVKFSQQPPTLQAWMLFQLCVLALETRRAWAELCGGRWREGNILFYHFSALQEEEFGSRRKSPSYDPQEFTL